MREKLIEKYEQELKNMIIMDDYDGGKAEAYRIVIDDLKKFRGSFSAEKKSIKCNTQNYKKNKNSA